MAAEFVKRKNQRIEKVEISWTKVSETVSHITTDQAHVFMMSQSNVPKFPHNIKMSQPNKYKNSKWRHGEENRIIAAS